MVYRKTPSNITEYLKGLGEIKDVFRFIKNEVMNKESKKYLMKTILFSFCVILFQALMPMTIGQIFSGLASKSFSLVVIGITSTTGLLLVQKLFERQMAIAREWILGIHWGNTDIRITELFFEKSPGQHIQEASLSIPGIERGRGNLTSIQRLIFFNAIPLLIQLIVSIVLIFIIALAGGGIMSVAMISYVGYSIYLNYNVMKVCTPIDKSMRRLNRRRVERMEKVTRVVVSSQEKREVTEMNSWFKSDIEKDIKFWIWFIKQSTWRSLINVILFAVIMIYGSMLVWKGVWLVGTLYPLLNWSTRIIDNIWQLGSTEQEINWNLPSIKAMIKALSIKPDVVNVANPIHLCNKTPARIVVENVSHSYPADKDLPPGEIDDADEDDSKENIIEDEGEVSHTLKKVSFTIESGEKVALLGPSGAGKTTIMRMLLRFMDPDSGSISVGGHNLKNISKESWKGSIGYIPQHAEVIDATIRENIIYRLSAEDRAKITDDEIWSLMRRLEIDFGKRLDKGLDTRVGKHGLKLSGGQAQRLMIGAAVIGNPWFMIIDEATSSLDSTTEKKVQKGLSESLSGNTSALIVAHRLSTVRHLCTKFVVLKPATDVVNGDSQVESVASSFEELYKISPTFRELADDQGIKIN